ncbi:MAG: hypothetical protein BJ554DRAFT_6811 [Olpidium bornovanus]|uniref:Uncharacterized protein n=1 Tax=Olpidium bornovanus TaxID=278681 RepID=A0A8H8A234_9FUNG|nr:MAG: hypothetical protein BJ554DRAFT_6811 [Olpidium bornovanus]
MRYLTGTKDLGLWFNEQDSGNDELAAFSDSDCAGCRITRASTTRIIIQLAGGAVLWRSARQKCISTSSCEAEVAAGSAAAQEIKWLRSLLEAIDLQVVVGPTWLMIDNTGAAELASDQRYPKGPNTSTFAFTISVGARRKGASGSAALEQPKTWLISSPNHWTAGSSQNSAIKSACRQVPRENHPWKRKQKTTSRLRHQRHFEAIHRIYR